MEYIARNIPLWQVTTWDKNFNNVDKAWQPRTIKYKYLLSDELDSLRAEDGDVRILYTGKDISKMYAASKWGNKLFEKLSIDLIDLLPNAKGFSPTNLRYMMRFYDIFNDISFIPQVEEQSDEKQIIPQVGEQFAMAKDRVFFIPWVHITIHQRLV